MPFEKLSSQAQDLLRQKAIIVKPLGLQSSRRVSGGHSTYCLYDVVMAPSTSLVNHCLNAKYYVAPLARNYNQKFVILYAVLQTSSHHLMSGSQMLKL